MPHSRLGIASLICFGFAVLLIGFGIATGAAGARSFARVAAQDQPLPDAHETVGRFFVIAGLCFDGVALLLGIAGLFERNRQKGFSIVGVVLASIIPTFCLLLLR